VDFLLRTELKNTACCKIKHMVFALLSESQTAEDFLGNFAEAEYELKYVSVIMKSRFKRNKIAEDAGPLKNTGFANLRVVLKTYKIDAEQIGKYLDGLNVGKVLIAIDHYSDRSITDMLDDYKPELLNIV